MTLLFEDIIEDIAISRMLGMECNQAHKAIYDLLEYLFGELYPNKNVAVRYVQLYRVCTFKYNPEKEMLYLNIRDMDTKNISYNTLFRSPSGYDLIKKYISHKHTIEIVLEYMQVEALIFVTKEIYE